MKDFVEGLVLAVKERIISIQLARAYLNAYVNKQFDITFSEDILEKIEKKYKRRKK